MDILICRNRALCALTLAAAFVLAPLVNAQFPGMQQPKHYAWSDASLSPDVRADLVIKEMTPGREDFSAAWAGNAVLCDAADRIERRRGILERDSAAGNSGDADGRLGLWRDARRSYGPVFDCAAQQSGERHRAWDPQAAYEYGALIGRELRMRATACRWAAA